MIKNGMERVGRLLDRKGSVETGGGTLADRMEVEEQLATAQEKLREALRERDNEHQEQREKKMRMYEEYEERTKRVEEEEEELKGGERPRRATGKKPIGGGPGAEG